MRLEEDIDFTTLNWVKPELDQALAQARQALEAYVEDPDHRGPMDECAKDLHQVQGTLRMVELYGAAMVAQEMEQLVAAILADQVPLEKREESYTSLMRGLMQMPDYLERLQSGHRDIPIVLLPLLNELRACRGEESIHESELFQPDLNVALPDQVLGAPMPPIAEKQRLAVTAIRLGFQQQLLGWLRGHGDARALQTMRDSMDALTENCFSIPGRRMWWITAAVLDGLAQGVLEAHGDEVKRLIGRVDRCIHLLITQGEAALDEGEPRDLTYKLLFYAARAEAGNARIDAVCNTYRLGRMVPDEAEVEHARGAMAGHNRALLDTVSQAIKEDLLRVKDALDLFLRQAGEDTSQLAAQVDVLDRAGDTLGMLGLNVPRRVVGEQRRVLEEIAAGALPADEDTLLDVAGALLYVEASLDDHIERLGSAAGEAEPEQPEGLPRSEARHVLAVVLQEAVVSLGKAKEAIVAFVESPWDHDELADVPRLLDEVGGAMQIMDAQRPVELLRGIARFVDNELLLDRRVPTVEQMDKLADALASVEYYLEAAGEHRGGLDHILDVTQQSLEGLGYWPVPARREAPAVPVETRAAGTAVQMPDDIRHELTESVSLAEGADLGDLVIGDSATPSAHEQDVAGMRLVGTEETAPPPADDDWIEIEEEIEEQLPVPDALAAQAGFQGASDDIDADIREVFLEEVQEEIDGLHSKLAEWRDNPEDLDRLVPIRRSFHTLKGSGRLVGAQALGEFSWKIENMLNRVLDGTVPPHGGIQALAGHAIDALPQLLEALQGTGMPRAPLQAMTEVADQLAAGNADATLEQHAPAQMETVRRTIKRRIPRGGEAIEPPTAAMAGVAAPEPGDEAFAPDVHAGPVLPPMDPVLVEILRSEVAQHLQTIRAALANAGAGDLAIDEPLLRAVHTLNGAIAMVEIPVLSHVLAPLESYLKRLRALDLPLPATHTDAMAASADIIEQVMAQFDESQPRLPDSTALAERLTELRDALPEPNLAHVLYHREHEQAHEELHDVPEPAGATEADADALHAATDDGMATEAVDEPIADLPEPAVDMPVDADDAIDAAVGAFAETVPQQAEPEAEGVTDDAAGDAEIAAFFTALESETAATPAGDATVDDYVFAPGETQDVPARDGLPEPAYPEAEEADAERTGTESGSESEVGTEAEADVGVDVATAAGFEAETEAEVETEAEAEAEPGVEAATAAGFEAETEAEAGTEVEAGPEAGFEEEAEAEPEVEAATGIESEAEPDAEPETEPAVASAAEADVTVAATAGTRAETSAALGPLSPGFSFPHDAPAQGPLDLPDMDNDLLDIFVEEGRDILDHADSAMALLREEPHSREHVASLQRDLHTLKGGARMAGLAPIGDLGHAMEALFEAISVGRREVDADIVESLERGFDLLNGLVQRVADRHAMAMPVNAIARFEELAEGAPAATAMDMADADRAAAAVEASEDTVVPIRRQPKVMPELLPELTEEDHRAPQEMIRVRAELLDSLVNYAGEVSIYRSRLEQQISGFRFNLVEFEQTVARLRDQLRKLEIETEAQIIARYQREHQNEGSFDPLELDRFSQLQQYSRALAESVADLVSLQNMLDDTTRQSETLLLQQSRVSSDLQEGLMRTRMVPFDSMVPTLRRTLRQAAQETRKRAQLRVIGAHGEMDRNLLERMKAPFEHMLRNALAHGIEDTAQRRRVGKPEEGTVAIDVSRDATEVVIRITDDGAGIDRDAIRAKAIERGLLGADTQLSDRDLFSFILESGFSTAEAVTQLAGRGVGMDVVANEIKQMGGALAIESERGKGTTFVVRLPFTLAVTQAILVKVGEAVFALPMTSVQGVTRIAREDLTQRLAEPEPSFTYAEETYSIHDLAHMLEVPAGHLSEDIQPPLLLTRSGDLRAAVRIDAVIGSREIVVKPVGPQISSVPGIFGATIMGDGSVVLILDLAPLVRHSVIKSKRDEQLAQAEFEAEAEAAVVVAPVSTGPIEHPVVMVVDDSITMRKVTGRILERHDYEVATAKDGLDALEKLQDKVPDLMLLDIEMPRMDGYELATHMKNDPRLRNVPIIMITSRSGEKHRQRAFDIGVNRYLGKPYQEAELLAQITELLNDARD